MQFTDIWTVRPDPAARSVVRGDGWRITVLTDRLLRLEYEPQGRFCNMATQAAIDRDFERPSFEARIDKGWLILETDALRLRYDQRPFSAEGLSAVLKGQYSVFSSVWHYGQEGRNLKGTARTLDDVDGAIELGDGVVAREGFAVLDQSNAMRMDAQGNLLPAQPHGIDLYLFAYGHDYRAALRDFRRLAGATPVPPRFALGNWWSRYYPYTEETYKALIERFDAENVPLSVAVLDMDWHVTDIDPKYGSGWTGYTWNREKFPDPARLLSWLHARGLRVTMNDHPADGVRACEEFYPEMAKALGIDPASGAPAEFDAADPAYLEALERHVLGPLEAMGVDFWWLDWQQAGGSSVPGVDPLFTLNHTRFLHTASPDAPGLAFSRYGGPGSHRYPIGFSGDSHITWDSLAFQPYFTATAANIGYGWWSHDIGGHMNGAWDEELSARWVQFGVFSPIMRLHSSNNDFLHKEPWSYSSNVRDVIEDFMRLRHALVPWLYSGALAAGAAGDAILYPVYYDWPDESEAYRAQRAEYMLGGEMLVCPITAPASPDTGLGRADIWLPEGRWVDFFTGRVYRGGQRLRVYRPLSGMPVLVRPGTIIPMDGAAKPANGCLLPDVLRLRVFAGGPGAQILSEDNALRPGCAGYRRCDTRVELEDVEALVLRVRPAEGDASLIPASRRLEVELVGAGNRMPDAASCGYSAEYQPETRTLRLALDVKPGDGVELRWNARPAAPSLDKAAMLRDMLMPMRMSNDDKSAVMRAMSLPEAAHRLAAWQCLALPEGLLGALTELEIVE